MKISNNIALLTLNQTKFALAQDESFEQLMHVGEFNDRPNTELFPMPAHWDRDYYWYHQQQLQQSALTFSPLPYQANQPLPDMDKTTTPPNNTNADSLPTQPPALLPPTKTANPTLPLLAIELVEQLEQVLTKIKHPANSLMLERNTPCLNNDLISNKKDSATVVNPPLPVLAPARLLKHHHLFLIGNVVELSINTSQLSPTQQDELHRLIKHWLTLKGYSLKQLMINGVLQ